MRPLMGKYILDEQGNPVLEPDVLKWANWFQQTPVHGLGTCNETSAQQRILKHTHVNGMLVSTVFMGIDHNWGMSGDPVLWETMIFPEDGPLEYQERYSSREAALEGHARAVLYASNYVFPTPTNNSANN